MAIFKNPIAKPSSGIRRMLMRSLFPLSMIALGITTLWGFWFLSQLGPKDVDMSKIGSPSEVPEAVKAIQQESIDLELRYDEIVAMREPNADDILLLEQALEKQEVYLTSITGFDSVASNRKLDLEERYQKIASQSLYQESHELERQAETYARNKDFENSSNAYRKAFEKQQELNETFPKSSAYSVGRATFLSRKVVSLSAEPLFQRSLAYEKEADRLEEEEEWEQAQEHLVLAINLQDKINRKYRGIRQADLSRLGQLQAKLIGIKSGQKYAKLERVLKLADSRRADNENFEASALYEEAARLQQEINDNYVEGPHTSAARVTEFLRNAETAKSLEIGLEIEHKHDLLRDLLSQRRTFEASDVIGALRRDIRQMQTSFPLSSLNDKDLQLKVRYLSLVQKDMGFIHDRIYDSLLPIPENDEWLMLRTEVSQALYTLIMGKNPSRNKGDLLPVDSVNWVDAKNFCERLTWILGKSVRLPNENEFRSVLGRLRYLVLEDHAWCSKNAGGVPQNIGIKKPQGIGFYDLLGNVSEWLESVDRFDSEEAVHIGGSALDSIETIFTVPLRNGSRGERSRLVGFRVVVKDN